MKQEANWLHYIDRHDNRVDLYCFRSKEEYEAENCEPLQQVQHTLPTPTAMFERKGVVYTADEAVDYLVDSTDSFCRETAEINLANLNVGEHLVIDLDFGCNDKVIRIS